MVPSRLNLLNFIAEMFYEFKCQSLQRTPVNILLLFRHKAAAVRNAWLVLGKDW